MAIYLGSSTPEKFYLGSAEIEKIYLGNTEIWTKSKLPNWYQDGWQDLLGPDSWYYPYRVYVAGAILTSGDVPNCEVMCCSFSDYYEYNNIAAQVTLQRMSDTTARVTMTRGNDSKRKKWVTFDRSTGQWSTAESSTSGYGEIKLIDILQPVPAFIVAENVPSVNRPIVTNIPYMEDL